jgi:adenosylcobinamide-GDP ribazoletransferase
MRRAHGLPVAVAMFTVMPVPPAWHRDATAADGRSALPWLPLVGLAVGAVAGLPAAAVLGADRSATLIAAVLAVAMLAAASRALHLDGLADTADGLASRRPAAEALAIMRRSDVGPFGVAALVLILLVDVAAVQRIAANGIWCATGALAVAAATGRLAVLHATGSAVRSARVDGFGSLVAGSTRPVAAIAWTVVVLGAGAGIAAITPHANVVGWPCSQAVALAIAWLVRLHVVRRLGGITGDVFGALIELATAATLIGLALT